ncbi:MAG TPA: hypothetical protein VEH30_11395 [Terriglobales bacterium]|nr:hypothetical protein [Terriglobales bacterium]
MRCSLAVAALGAALLAMPAYAQHAGGGHGGGFGGHGGGGFAAHGAAGGMRAPAIGVRTSGFIGARPGFHPGYGYPRGPVFPGHYPRPGFYPGWGWGWGGYPWGWGGYGYPWLYGNVGWYDTPYYSQPYYSQYDYSAQNYSPNNQLDQELQAEVDRLNDEVASLREREQEMQKSRQAAPSAVSSKPTQLIFSDKHTEEIQNYAIVGQTLWVLTAERARKIPLSDLDLSATKKANEDRGGEFDLPK